MTQQYRLASMAAWLSSTSISCHNLLPHVLSVHVSAVNKSPCPGIIPQSIHYSSQLPYLLWDLCPCPRYVWLCLIFIPFRLPEISCFTLSLKCFSSDSEICPNMGIRPLLQFPKPPRADSVLQTLLFFPLVPLPYQILCDSVYSFLMIRYSWPL